LLKNITTSKGRSFCANIKCVSKWSGLELFAPIASNKNMQESNKNMEVMTRATKAQLPKYVVGAMTYEKITLCPH
jgi:hypothetical protein